MCQNRGLAVHTVLFFHGIRRGRAQRRGKGERLKGEFKARRDKERARARKKCVEISEISFIECVTA